MISFSHQLLEGVLKEDTKAVSTCLGRLAFYKPAPRNEAISGWYSCPAVARKVNGSTYMDYDCHISPDEKQLLYAMQLYIRYGAIILQMAVQNWVLDRTLHAKHASPNPLTMNV